VHLQKKRRYFSPGFRYRQWIYKWLILMDLPPNNRFDEIVEMLNKDSSRAVVDACVAMVDNNALLFARTRDLAVQSAYPVNMRAARVVEQCVRHNKQLAINDLAFYVGHAERHETDGIKRAFIKIISYFVARGLPEDLLGRVIDMAFKKLLSHGEPVAVKAYSIDLLLQIVEIEPDLKGEFVASLEDQILKSSHAMDLKIKKTLDILDKTGK